MSAKYWVAQYIGDLFRNEPRNIGVLVDLDGAIAARFLAEGEFGRLDGRKLRFFRYPDVYRQWISFWRAEITVTSPDSLIHLKGSHYRVIAGGEVDDIEASTAEDVTNYLYALLVSEGSLTEALGVDDDAEDYGTLSLTNEVVSALERDHLLATHPIFAPHPVQRSAPIVGALKIEHRPAFIQRNGLLYVMETVDFAVPRKTRSRDHAGWTAYIFKDIKAAHPPTRAIAIIRVTDPDMEHDEVTSGLALLQNEGQVINWLKVEERQLFLDERRDAAFRMDA